MNSYDLIVIGTGTTAQVAAGRVREAGRTVAVIDHRPFGGTCALRGCDPKKMLVSGTEAVDWGHRLHRRGVVGDLRLDWALPKRIVMIGGGYIAAEFSHIAARAGAHVTV